MNNFTSSINNKTGSFVLTSSFNAYTSSVTSALNGKANLAGGNTFSGDQIVDGSGKLIAYSAVTTPVIIGKTGDKTDIPYGSILPIYTFASGSYSALIMDSYIIASDPEYYTIQSVFAIPNSGDQAAISPYIFSIDSLKTSFSASAVYNERGELTVDATFNTGSVVLSSDYNGSNARILVENLCQDKQNNNLNITYRTIIRAFPTS
jgi:hypothetical protein